MHPVRTGGLGPGREKEGEAAVGDGTEGDSGDGEGGSCLFTLNSMPLMNRSALEAGPNPVRVLVLRW